MQELKLASSFEVQVYKLLRRHADMHNLRLNRHVGDLYVLGSLRIELLPGESLRADGRVVSLQGLAVMLNQRVVLPQTG